MSAPGNLSIVVLDNGHYGETGGQLSHTGLGVDLGAVARAMGFPRCIDVATDADLAPARAALHQLSGGPSLVRVRIAHEETPRALPTRDGVFLTERLRAHLGL